MGRIAATIAIAESSLSTGNAIGDATSYGALVLIGTAAWRLFRWWRADVNEAAAGHDAEIARYQRNQLLLLGHITLLSIALAATGTEVPPPPTLE